MTAMHCLEERLQAPVIFDPWRRFDARRYVDAVRPHSRDRIRDIPRRQSTRENRSTPTGHLGGRGPVHDLTGAAAPDRIVNVEKNDDVRRPDIDSCRVIRADGNRFHHRPIDRARVVRALVPMELYGPQPCDARDTVDVFSRLIDENADGRDERGQRRHDCAGMLRIDAARALRPEDEPECIGTAGNGRFGIFEPRDPADLYEHGTPASSSRSAAPGSEAVMNRSPMRKARYPNCRSLSRSSEVRRPLSLTEITSFGMRAISVSDAATSTVNVRRFLLFTPMIAAPASSAMDSSSALCTSTSASRPLLVAQNASDRTSTGVSAATTSRIASAPAAFASRIWYSETMKSFRRIGSGTTARTARRWSSEPSKNVGSVSTEIAAAPAAA